MSFSDAELEAHCDEIIKDPAIRNRVVVLCEGDSTPFKPTANAARIKAFAETTQDSAFYYRAIPEWWRTTRRPEPSFYVCGNQENVIKAYCYLNAKHQTVQPSESYLSLNKLFALIDIDLNNKKIPKGDYPFKDLWSIYQDLYQHGKVNNGGQGHAIWVTGLLHKEAYFLIPEMQDMLSQHYGLDLPSLYQNMLQDMNNRQDIRDNFTKAKNRIHHHHLSNSPSIEDFQNNWLDSFTHPQATEADKDALAYILLTFAKSKPEWERIKSPNGSKMSPKAEINTNYRNQLCFRIAKEFYAKEAPDSEHHLPRFFNRLSQAFKSPPQ